MTEYFRITGKNTILFDTVGGGPYVQSEKGKPPEGLSEPLTRQEAMGKLSQVPLEIRPHILMRGLSIITFEITITGTTDADMEAKRHDLTETLEDTTLYFSTQGGRGTRAELLLKADGAVGTSYKSIFYGVCEEQVGRDVLGALIKEHRLYAVKVTLYCEPYWRPVSAIELGPNEIKTPSFERDSNADGLADNWVVNLAPICAMESTIVLNGCKSQKITSDAVEEGVASTTMVAPAGTTQAVAYAWICRPAAGSDIKVRITDTSVWVVRDEKLLSAGGWQTKVVGGNTWYRIVVFSSALVPGNNHSLYIMTVAATPTVFYVDAAFLKWGTIVPPDEWIDHYLIYNHEDNDVGHINHMDLADLKGDVEAPIRLKKKVLITDTYHQIRIARAFRRTRGSPCALLHQLEAESANTQSNWPDKPAPDTECSNGNCVSQGAGQTAGYIIWQLTANPDDLRGGMYPYARLKGVIATSKFKATMKLGTGIAVIWEGKWISPAVNNAFQLLPLGKITIPPSEVPAGGLSRIDLQIEYSKADADVVECDFLQLAPSDESVFGIDCVSNTWYAGAANEYVDIDLRGITNAGIGYLGIFDTLGDLKYVLKSNAELLLKPGKDNRLYFHWVQGTAPWHHVRNADANPTKIAITLAYLPQYISPLE